MTLNFYSGLFPSRPRTWSL